MSTKAQTVSEAKFDPGSMSAFQRLGMGGIAGGVLEEFMNNPLTASYFTQQLGMGNRQISQMGQGNISNILGSLTGAGFGAGGANPLMAAFSGMAGRAQSGQRANLFGNLLMGANQLRMGATQTAAGYRAF